MPRYLFEVKYRAEGVQGLLKDGGTRRRATVEQVVKPLGARIEAFYYAFGDVDAISIIEAPDHVTTAALALAINASGTVQCKTTVLLTPEEIDAATKKTVAYRPPGG